MRQNELEKTFNLCPLPKDIKGEPKLGLVPAVEEPTATVRTHKPAPELTGELNFIVK